MRSSYVWITLKNSDWIASTNIFKMRIRLQRHMTGQSGDTKWGILSCSTKASGSPLCTIWRMLYPIHKAQGLEYDSIKIIIPNSNSERISHGIFYTAITRTKEKLKIFWSSDTMNKIISGFSEERCNRLSLDIVKAKLIGEWPVISFYLRFVTYNILNKSRVNRIDARKSSLLGTIVKKEMSNRQSFQILCIAMNWWLNLFSTQENFHTYEI